MYDNPTHVHSVGDELRNYTVYIYIYENKTIHIVHGNNIK